LVENALGRAALMSPDPHAGLPELETSDWNEDSLGIYDTAVLELSPEAKIRFARQVEAICLSEPKVKKSHGASFNTSHGALTLANSKGFSGTYRRTACSCGVTLQAGEGDNLFDEGWTDAAVRLDRLMEPEALARKAILRVTRLIGARKVETQNVPVVMEPPVASGFLGFLAQCVNGGNVYLRQSFLADKIGQAVAGSNVTVTDDGRIPGAPGTRPFDSEGVPTRRTPVIEKGTLKSYLLDTYAARKLNLRSTGNASGLTNFWMQAGTDAPEEIVRSLKKGLLLTGTIGFGLVATTGDISQGAFGLWIEDGQPVFPVAEITLSGNLGTLLSSVESIGNDPDRKRSASAPTLKIAEMTVGGK
jgi:PmbA protein